MALPMASLALPSIPIVSSGRTAPAVTEACGCAVKSLPGTPYVHMWCCMVYTEYRHIPGVQRSYLSVYDIQLNETKAYFFSMSSCMKVILNYITLIDDKEICNTKYAFTNIDIVEI